MVPYLGLYALIGGFNGQKMCCFHRFGRYTILKIVTLISSGFRNQHDKGTLVFRSSRDNYVPNLSSTVCSAVVGKLVNSKF